MMRCMRYRSTAEQAAGPGVLDMMRVGFFNDGTLAGTTDGGTFLGGSTEDDPEFEQLDRESRDMVSGYSGWLTVEHPGARDMLKAAAESFGFVAACPASKQHTHLFLNQAEIDVLDRFASGEGGCNATYLPQFEKDRFHPYRAEGNMA